MDIHCVFRVAGSEYLCYIGELLPSPEFISCPLCVSIDQCSILNFIKMLPLTRRTGGDSGQESTSILKGFEVLMFFHHIFDIFPVGDCAYICFLFA